MSRPWLGLGLKAKFCGLGLNVHGVGLALALNVMALALDMLLALALAWWFMAGLMTLDCGLVNIPGTYFDITTGVHTAQ